MRPVQNNLHLLPDGARIGSCTVYWIKWYKRFSEPFISILSGLSRGIVWGKVPYEDRKRRAVDRVVVNRRLSRHDLFVVHVVLERHRAQHVEFIKAKTAETDGPWKKILCDFLHARALPSTQLSQACSFFF